MFNYKQCISYPVENVDTEGGTFTLNCQAKITSGSDPVHVGKTFTDTDSAYIGPGETKALQCGPFDIDAADTMSYQGTAITPGTKTIVQTGTEQVQKSRPVTKYRTETQYRTTTKYRTEKRAETVTQYHSLLSDWFG